MSKRGTIVIIKSPKELKNFNNYFTVANGGFTDYLIVCNDVAWQGDLYFWVYKNKTKCVCSGALKVPGYNLEKFYSFDEWKLLRQMEIK